MSAPRLLDLYSCAGGAAMGYHRAGWEVVGVDIKPQPHYPFEHHTADALEYLAAHWQEFDAIHASPPCQLYSATRRLAVARGATTVPPDLLGPTRDALQAVGLPYIIENVPGAPMEDYLTLCGSEFGLIALDTDGELLQLRRHRQFESNVYLMGAGGCRHLKGVVTASVYGHGGGWTSAHRRDPARGGGYVPHLTVCRELMGMDWTTKRELSESIPPAYTQHLGLQLLASLEVAA